MITDLANATALTCGRKAAALADLFNKGFPVPEGFVIPFEAYQAACLVDAADPNSPDHLPAALAKEVEARLASMGHPPVAVRSSAAGEDTANSSAAGQYATVLAVSDTSDVLDAIRVCWRSARSDRVSSYHSQAHCTPGDDDPRMAVLVQRLVGADVSGVMFTSNEHDGACRIEASWGLGPSVVEGAVSPDIYEVQLNRPTRRVIAEKPVRLDRDSETGNGTVSQTVPDAMRWSPALDDPALLTLAAMGRDIAAVLGAPQDIEWAIAGGQLWILQARPITAPLPDLPASPAAATENVLTGRPGSHGRVTGAARILRSPTDIPRTLPGDIIVCPYTDPAWTPLFRIAGGIITEAGGALSHAAIVAREHGIPAVLGIVGAMGAFQDGERITINGTEGTVTRNGEAGTGQQDGIDYAKP